jgi:hypothetical protein
MPTEYPGSGDEWQARLKDHRVAEERGAIDRAARLTSHAARIASRKLREEAVRRAFHNWGGPKGGSRS